MGNYATVNYATSPPQVDIARNYNASVDLIDRNLERGLANKTALIDNDGCYTCAELAERVKRAGNALQKAGAEMETRAMLWLLDDVDFPSVFLGAIRTGVIAISVNTLLTSNDYDYMLRDSRARIVVVSDTLLERFEPILAGQPHLKTVVVAGTQSTGHQHLQTLMAQATACADVAPTTADETAFWLYTSGSTGGPKGSIHLHSDLVVTAALYAKPVLGITQDVVVFSAAKYFFAYGLGNSFTFPL
jgi:benzoate-CoA ligase